MQKSVNYPIENFDIEFPNADLPVYIEEHQEQNDDAITYLHAHSISELGLCLDGSGIFAVENKVFSFHPDEVFYLAPNIPHLACSALHSSSHWTWIYIDFYKILQNQALVEQLRSNAYTNLYQTPNIIRLLKELLELHHRESPQKLLKMRAKLLELAAELIELSDLSAKMDHPVTINPEALARIQRAINYMAKHYMEKVELQKLAKICGLSMTHFRRLFAAGIGMKPLQYLTYLRLSVVKTKLLKTQSSIQEAAYNCGFPTISCFNRQFMKQNGCSPSQWRKKQNDIKC